MPVVEHSATPTAPGAYTPPTDVPPGAVYSPPPGWSLGAPGDAPPEPAAWPPALRVLFRFATALVLFTTVSPFPGALLRWVARHVLGLPGEAAWYPNGAGDKTIAWAQLACAWAAAALVAAAWTALDRRRAHYARAHGWLRTLVRYTLGAEMLLYGWAKIFQAQFPPVALGRLVEPYGEFSPMSVLWTMMGHSASYNAFCGAAEAAGAVLLFWRRTTPLGALLTAASLANVVALNFGYDVTVKLHSLGLLALALVLLAPDARRLWAAVAEGRAVGPSRTAAPALDPGARPWQRRLRLGLKAVLVTAAVGGGGYTSFQQWRAQTAPPGPLWGLYDVEAFAVDGAARAPLATDPVRWRRLALDRGGRATVQVMSDSVRRFAYAVNDGARLLTITRPAARAGAQPATEAEFTYAEAASPRGSAPARVTLDGTVGGRPARLVLRRVDHTRFTLVSRGFHWVQDDNFQR